MSHCPAILALVIGFSFSEFVEQEIANKIIKSDKILIFIINVLVE